MNKGIIDEQQRVYTENFKIFGDSPRGTFQNDRHTQHLRFERLLSHIAPQEGRFTIHDVGCGIAHLHDFLLDRDIAHEYSGTEIVQEMIDAARAKHPGVRFYNRDILLESCEDEYDYVVLSGVFNIPGNVPVPDWKQFAFALISKMFSMCRRAIAFNFLTAHNTFSSPDLAYFKPEEIFEFCVENLSRFVVLDHGYPLYEFSITVWKPGYVKSRYPEDAFSRYFAT